MIGDKDTLVTVYSKADCSGCKMTKKVLDKNNVEYREERIDLNPEALAKVKEMGYLQAPVVVAPDGSHWGGFRPDLLNNL